MMFFYHNLKINDDISLLSPNKNNNFLVIYGINTSNLFVYQAMKLSVRIAWIMKADSSWTFSSVLDQAESTILSFAMLTVISLIL